MQRAKKVVLTPANTDDDNVSTSQTPGGAGDLTITGAAASGGVATLDMPRRVLVTTGADESGRILTIYGTADGERVISETMTGPNNTTGYTTKNFKTITRVAIDGAASGAIKVGTNGVLSSPWMPVGMYDNEGIGFDCIVSGTLNYTIEHTMDDPFSAVPVNGIVDTYLNPFGHPSAQGKTASFYGSYDFPVRAVRATINSYSSGASLTFNMVPRSG